MVTRALQSVQGALDWSQVQQCAGAWIESVRGHPPAFWVLERLLQQFPLSSAEGLALMRLAEALLRVPDTPTAIALASDQLGRAEFECRGADPLGRWSRTLVGLARHWLPLRAPVLERMLADHDATTLGARTVVAASLRALQLLGRQFVLGQTLDQALREAQALRQKQDGALHFSYDMLGEGARTEVDAQRYLQRYTLALDALARGGDGQGGPQQKDGISIKLSALYPRYEDVQRERVLQVLVPRVWALCERAARADLNLTLDAEEVDRLELSLQVLESLLERVARNFPQWQGFGLALQAYQTRALDLTHLVIALARKHQVRLMCRLVKGAYWDTEIKRAQELGLAAYPVFTHKHHTDASYLACAQVLLAAPDAVFAQFASHNAVTIAAVLQLAARSGAAFELQRLHGMGEGVYREVLKDRALSCRVYAPVGEHRDLLAYLVRRLLENGANSSFVHQLGDVRLDSQQLLTSPLHLTPQSALPLPPALFGDQVGARKNSQGLDLSQGSVRAHLQQVYAVTQVPVVAHSSAQQVALAQTAARGAWDAWSNTPVAERAQVLRRAADAMQAQLPQLSALLVKEAFKTWPDAVSEVREAVDFLRYYADEAVRIQQPMGLPGVTGETNTLRLRSRGVWVCISPWNFPLAIFTGQVAAALVTGNTVLAKPAEQTPAIAQCAVQLLHAAGVPQSALQLLCGPGSTVGAALVTLPGVAGVVFTGSTAVARTIQRALAAQDGPLVALIAETGGINAMLVDSTALPEQVVDAVLQSAFRSAGQRCSALRLLCVHEAIADAVIRMLQGAVSALVLGDPADPATDIGPVIDRAAYEHLQQQVRRLQTHARPLLDPAMSGNATAARPIPHLMAPQAFEIANLEGVDEEIFGPVLQVLRWSGDPVQLVANINALGFGLTLGIQTRIDSRAQALADTARVGNVYVNRNMVGAVVGVQPFGGEGLSGTGPKAGGPFYLYRFCTEQTVTVNTTAAGGNAALLSV